MAKAIVHSGICGFDHVIEGRKNGETIAVDIVTSCEKIGRMSHMQVPIMDILDIKENYIINKAREFRCSSTCLVPCGVLHVCRIEAGLLSESLCKKVGHIGITFE